MRITLPLALICISLLLMSPAYAAGSASVSIIRLPVGGVQPQALVDEKGVVHLIYLAGDPSHADIFAISSADNGRTFTTPVRVNSQPGSAIALGTVRGAHMAIGKDQRILVAWMGSSSAEPRAVGKATPMLYARSTQAGNAFEPQRNVIGSHVGLDGGGSIAADARGNIYIAWHAPPEENAGEQSRRVWLTQSHDAGETFASETPITTGTGACGCCGLRLTVSGDRLFVLYRTADQKIERDMTLVRLDPKSQIADIATIGKMKSATCVMSTSALASTGTGAIGAWETAGQIFWSAFPASGEIPAPLAVPGESKSRKHPAIAINAAGQTLIAWTEGTAWNRGGSVAWQLYDNANHPIESATGRADNLPAWGLPAAFANGDGSFVVVY